MTDENNTTSAPNPPLEITDQELHTMVRRHLKKDPKKHDIEIKMVTEWHPTFDIDIDEQNRPRFIQRRHPHKDHERHQHLKGVLEHQAAIHARLTATLKGRPTVEAIASVVDGILSDEDHQAAKDEFAKMESEREAILHPLTSATMKRGRVTIAIGLTVGDGSPHTWEHRSKKEFEEILRTQVGNLMKESSRKPMTLEEHQAFMAKVRQEAAERELANRIKHEAEQRAAMTPEARYRYDYHKLHGEHPYDGDLDADLLAVQEAANLGAYTPEEAEAEKSRYRKWHAEHGKEARASRETPSKP